MALNFDISIIHGQILYQLQLISQILIYIYIFIIYNAWPNPVLYQLIQLIISYHDLWFESANQRKQMHPPQRCCFEPAPYGTPERADPKFSTMTPECPVGCLLLRGLNCIHLHLIYGCICSDSNHFKLSYNSGHSISSPSSSSRQHPAAPGL